MARKQLPDAAGCVIVGGGVGGASIAYHLAKLGYRDVVLVDRAELTSGSTFHSAGLVGQLRGSVSLTKMMMHSVDVYRGLADESELDPGWVECGGIRLASSEQRMEELRRQAGWAKTFGLPLELISADEAREMFPLMSTDGVLGAAWLPTDGYIDPSQLTYALADVARREGGLEVFQNTRVTGIEVDGGRVRAVETDAGRVEAEVVVNAGGMFAAEIGRLAGVRVPVIPFSHQYLVTQPFREHSAEQRLPTLRDPDLLIYFREDGGGLVMGGYERNSEPAFLPRRARGSGRDPAGLQRPPARGRLGPLRRDHRELQAPGARHGRGHDHEADQRPRGVHPRQRVLPRRVGGSRLLRRRRLLRPRPRRRRRDRPGDRRVDRRGRAEPRPLGDGRAPLRRPVPVARPTRTPASARPTRPTTTSAIRTTSAPPGGPLRVSAANAWHADHGAAFGEKSGWERVNWYESNAAAGDDALRPRGWAGRHWSPAIGAEHRATRESVAIFDESSFAKLEIGGPGAAAVLERLCDNRVARAEGQITYTQMLNRRGGIECDFTVARLGEELFSIVTGTAFGNHDREWIRKHLPEDGSAQVRDVTSAWSCFGIWGPRSREVLAELTPADLGNDAFPYMSAREITVGNVPVRALRVTYVGELGWEIYCPTEYGLGLWRALWEAGEPRGIVAGGYRAIDSMRLEKGYRVWGADITPDETPYEGGVGFCVKLDKDGGFIGRDALAEAKERGPRTRLCCLTLSDPRSVALGNEPVRIGGEIVGRVTTGGYGYTVERSIAYAYLPPEHAAAGTPVEVEIFGEWVGGEVSAEPLFDPKGERIRA